MHNNIIHARLVSPQQIVDVGCGTGIVTRYLGDTYSTAKVYGIDISPVPDRQRPSNVEYILGDVRNLINNDEHLAFGSTDFVFSRLLVLGMTDWPGYVRDMASLLRPGGQLEAQDFVVEGYLYGDCCSVDWEWLNALKFAAKQNDLDLQCGRNIKGYMEMAGLVDIKVREYRLPLGTWLAEENPETRRIGEHAAREYGMLYYNAVPKMLQDMGYAEEKIEDLRSMTFKDLAGREGAELKFYVTVGRKP